MCRSYKACVSECSKSVGGRVVLRSRDDDLRGRGCLQVPKEVLMTICTREQMEEIRRNSLSLMRSDITQPLVQSETDSNGCFHSNKRWIIRLQEVASEPTWQKSLTLALAATDGIIGGRLESTNKGKEKSHRSSNWWKSVLELQMSSGYVDPGLGTWVGLTWGQKLVRLKIV
ncbi:hypothetical protein F2Q70_00007037 [Brassica cretica]|uniref:Uncharacterized protein n=1 Tax=Brassica cretica TaxID=69181 RepID=A0A8S9MEC6_BRACR|nr:hypothetical protein F2Q70_00007037 [Brassica cretica]